MDENSNHVSIDIPFSAPITTSSASGIILRTVIEFLSYHRKQIPFPYDTYKFMTSKIKTQMSTEGPEDDLLHMRIARQQRLATDTFYCLKTLLENIVHQLKTIDCLQALILFGATSLTAKEAFLVNIPSITKHHHSANHPEAIRNMAKSVTMSILTSQKLYEIESKSNTTNMFVLLRPRKAKLAENNHFFQLNEDFKLPRNCKTVVLNLKNVSNPITTNCCQHLVVFDDLIDECEQLKLTDSYDKSTEMNVEYDQKKNEYDVECDTLNQEMWYESTVFVRGFKDVLVNGKSLWNI